MKLFYKIYLFLIVLLILVLGGAGYISYHREVALFNSDMENDDLFVGSALSGLIEDVWKKSGMDRVLTLINDANRKEHQFKIRWVWLDNPASPLYVPHVPPEKLGKVIQGNSLSLTMTTADGEEFLITYVPVRTDQKRPGAIELSESLLTAKRYTHNSLMHLLYTTVLLLLAVGGLLWYRFQKWIHQPLTRFIDKSGKIGEGDFAPDLFVTGRDEFAQLARTLNSMCEKLNAGREAIRIEHEKRIAALDQLRHNERLAMLGRLSAGMAHELGTPLNVISGRSKLIRSGDLNQNEVIECSRIIGEQTERMTNIMRNLLDFARRRPPERSLQDMEQIVLLVLDMLSSTAAKAKVTFDLITDSGLPRIAVDSAQLQQVLTNLVINGIQAMPSGGRLEVQLAVEEIGNKTAEKIKHKYLAIRVRDEGEGIAKENRGHLFEPFFTTKAVGTGTGLGLSIAFGIIEEHGGWIDVESEPGQGACFTIFLPIEVDK